MIYRVAPVNLGAGTGNSWQDAMDLQAAIASAVSGDELWLLGENNIWNVGGRYQLTATWNINFPNLHIYGGFRGTEASLAQRNALIACNNPAFPDYFVYPSILEGGLNQSLQFPIISFINANDCILDGFIIEQGLHNIPGAVGSGLSVYRSNNFTMENVVLRQNLAEFGSGIYLHMVSSSALRNCIVENNTSQSLGGGLSLENCSNINLWNVLFFGNRLIMGASGNGSGAIYVDNSSQIIFNNITVADNFIQNVPPVGEGIYCINSNVEIYNSIFYPDDIAWFPIANIPTIDYCMLNQIITGQNGFGIPSQFATPPFPPPNFVNQGAPAWNYHLRTNPPFAVPSPCIDAGNATLNPAALTTDLEGKPRVMGADVDMGVFETP